jgi:hypothetical protein
LGIPRLPLGSLETKWDLGARLVTRHRGGRWWLLPSLGRGKSCESVFAHGLFEHQKLSGYALTNLLFGLCMSVRVIDWLSFFLIPSWNSNTPLYPWSAASHGVRPNSFSFRYLHLWTCIWVHKKLGCASIIVTRSSNIQVLKTRLRPRKGMYSHNKCTIKYYLTIQRTAQHW